MYRKLIAINCPFATNPTHFVASVSSRERLYSIFMDTDNNAFVHPFPTEEELISFYNRGEYVNGQGSIVRSTDQLTTIKKSPYFTPKGHLLDIGAGKGFLLSLMKQLGLNVVGIDFSEPAVQFALSEGLSKEEIRLGGLETVPRDRDYDLITLMDVLEHVRDPKGMLQGIARLMTPTTILFIKTMFHDDWYGTMIGSETYWQNHSWEHIFVPSISGLASMLLDQNLELLEIQKQEKSGPILSAKIIIGHLEEAKQRVSTLVNQVYQKINDI